MPNTSARWFVLAVLVAATTAASVAAQAPEQPREGIYVIKQSRPARVTIPDFVASSGDAQAAAIGRTIAEVLWNDLEFEHEFAMIPRGAATDAATPDAVIHGTVDVRSGVATVEVRLVPAGQQEPSFSRRYTGSTANPRAFAHTIADQIHERALFRVTR